MFHYHGDVIELTSVLDEYRERMTQAYQKVLGPELFGILESADAQLLGLKSFQRADALAAHAANRTRETTLGANKFFVAVEGMHAIKFAADGHFKSGRIEAAPGFVLRREGFEGSRKRYERWISPYLAPYIHEYDHFLLFALQERPMMVALVMMAGNFKVPRMPLRLEDIEMIAQRIMGSRNEKIMAAQLLMWAYSFQELYEISTRALDREIFMEMGLSVPATYFAPNPKFFLRLPMPKLNTIGVVAQGDSLESYSIQRRLETLCFWVERFNVKAPFQMNFLESFARLEIKKCLFGDILR